MRIKFTKVRTAEIVPLVALFFGVLFALYVLEPTKETLTFGERCWRRFAARQSALL